MSSYLRHTKHPTTKKWQDALWLDDYFGQHNYGVLFLDGSVFDPNKCPIETKDKRTKARFEEFDFHFKPTKIDKPKRIVRDAMAEARKRKGFKWLVFKATIRIKLACQLQRVVDWLMSL